MGGNTRRRCGGVLGWEGASTLRVCLMLLLFSAGCRGLWDNTSCWPSSALGQTVEVACPRFLWMLVGRNGNNSAWAAVGQTSGWALAWRRAAKTSLGTGNEWEDGSGPWEDGSGPCWRLEASLGGVWGGLSCRCQARGQGAKYQGRGEGGQACSSLPCVPTEGLPSFLPHFWPLSTRGPCSGPHVWVPLSLGWPSKTLTSSVPSLLGPADELCPLWKLLVS